MSDDHDLRDLFGEVIHAYTRADAIADGTLVDVSAAAPAPRRGPAEPPADCLARALRVLSRMADDGLPVRFSLVIGDGPPAARPLPAAGPPEDDRPGPGPLRERIVDALAAANGPIKCDSIAKRIGRAARSGSFREALRILIDDGEVVEYPGFRYWVPSPRPEPPLPAPSRGTPGPADRTPRDLPAGELARRIAAARAAKAEHPGEELSDERIEEALNGHPRK
jgi:hypothetical protein